MTVEQSRRERKKEETRHRIFHAAIELFRERGFEATTVDQITERADVAKGTFFNYFPKKDAVLAYLSEERLQQFQETAGVMLAEDRPVREKLLDLYCNAASAYEQHRELSRYVLIELLTRAFQPGEETAVSWQELVMGLIRQGQANGELRRDADPARIEALLTGVHYATLYEWVCCTEDCFPVIEELRARLNLAMEGMTP